MSDTETGLPLVDRLKAAVDWCNFHSNPSWLKEDLNDAVNKIQTLQASLAAKEKECGWYQEDEDCSVWRTDCNNYFELTCDTPEEHNFKHCCFCGGSLKQIPFEETD